MKNKTDKNEVVACGLPSGEASLCLAKNEM
jgi:hypothetical protein